jgi:hypothetical protein
MATFLFGWWFGFLVGIGCGSVAIVFAGARASAVKREAAELVDRMFQRVQYSEADSAYWRDQCDEVMEELELLKED